jgi:hypothetical protein
MSDLENFVKTADANSPFITFVEGEPIEGVYKGVQNSRQYIQPWNGNSPVFY